MDLHPWMLLVPAVMSAGAVPLARRRPVLAWVWWVVTALLTVVAVGLFAVAVAFLQTVLGAGLGLLEGDPAGSRGHVDLMVLAPWAVTATVVVAGTGIAVRRSAQVDSGVA